MKILRHGMGAALLALALSGCLSSHVAVFNPVDNANRTISILAADSVLTATIKQRLQRSGWQVADNPDPAQAGAAPAPAPTRYSLTLRQNQTGTCYPKGGTEVNYSLVVMDNRTRDAVVMAEGRECSDAIADKFIAALRGAGRH